MDCPPEPAEDGDSPQRTVPAPSGGPSSHELGYMWLRPTAALGHWPIISPCHTRLAATAVLAAAWLTCFGCKTAAKLDAVPPPGSNGAVYEVIPARLDDRSRAHALIVKREEQAGCLPLVFFRCFDGEGLTIRVAETAVTQLADAEKGASVAIWAVVPPGARRVEVTAICDSASNK